MTRLAVALLSFALLAAPLAAEAQSGRVYRIGYLTPLPLPSAFAEALRQGLRDLGYIEGRHVVIEARSAQQRYGDLQRLAAELAAVNVDVIVAATGTTALAAKQATSKVPIVMAGSADVDTQGIVASLARPGGNVTGVTSITAEMAQKRLELLKEMLPGLRRVAALWCPEHAINHVELRETGASARSLRLQVAPVEYKTPPSWEAALRQDRPDALVMFDCTALPFGSVVDFALQSRLPTISPYAFVTRQGGLLSYGPDFLAMSRRAAVFVDRILKGAKPADLPVEQPTKVELIINRATRES